MKNRLSLPYTWPVVYVQYAREKIASEDTTGPFCSGSIPSSVQDTRKHFLSVLGDSHNSRCNFVARILHISKWTQHLVVLATEGQQNNGQVIGNQGLSLKIVSRTTRMWVKILYETIKLVK